MMDPKQVFIFHNDLTDSDNWASAKVLWEAAQKNPALRIIWIIEPRQVAFGLYTTQEQQRKCVELLEEKLLAKKNKGFKTLLNGLKEHNLQQFEGTAEMDLLKLAVRPGEGPKEDAVLHGRFMALRFGNFLAELDPLAKQAAQVLLDVESLDSLADVVNMNIHDHEELVDLPEADMKQFRDIMNGADSARVEKHRGWYNSLVAQEEEKAKRIGASISNLDIDSLCAIIKDAKSVKFFGGSSAGLVERLCKRGVAGKIQYYAQLGTFDPERNIFSNQFNVALNIGAARFVLSRHKEFERFVIVPSDSTLKVKYPLAALSGSHQHLAKRFLAFNCRVDITKLGAEGTTDDIAGKRAAVPDLTAFLCAFSLRFPGVNLSRASLVDENGRLTLKRKDSGDDNGILVCDVQAHEFEGDEIQNIISGVSLDGWSI